MKSIFFILSSILFLNFSATAAPLIGKIIRIQGDGHLLNNGSPQAAGPQPRLKYQGQFYTYQPIKIGAAFRPGDIIHTSSTGRARVAFTNGDQITVGPSTSYRHNAEAADENETNFLHLFYGKIRSFMSKRKKTNMIRVKTSTVTAGVRGTDFFMSHHPTKGTEVTVLRGVVDVESTAKEKGQVKSGQTASISIKIDDKLLDAVNSASKDLQKNEIEKSNSVAKQSNSGSSITSVNNPSSDSLKAETEENYLKPQTNTSLVINETQKSDLNYISETTSVKKLESKDELSRMLGEPKADVQKEFAAIQALETLSIEKVVEDVKKYNPNSQIEISKITNVDQINRETVVELVKTAPNDKPNKPKREELDELGKDSYDKYFKGK